MFKKNRFSKALHESADSIIPSSLTYQSILAGVMPNAVQEGRVSYSLAREQIDGLVREKIRYRRRGAASFSLAVVAIALLLFIMPDTQNLNYIPDNAVPLTAMPNEVMIINCTIAEDGYLQVSVPGEEVSWQSLYALDQNGDHIAPYAVYPELEMAIFAPPDGDMVIYVSLISGELCSYVLQSSPSVE